MSKYLVFEETEYLNKYFCEEQPEASPRNPHRTASEQSDVRRQARSPEPRRPPETDAPTLARQGVQPTRKRDTAQSVRMGQGLGSESRHGTCGHRSTDVKTHTEHPLTKHNRV